MNRLPHLITLLLLLWTPWLRAQNPEISFQLGHHTGVHRIICDQSFSSLFSADNDGNLVHWDMATGRQVRMFSSPGEPVSDLLLLEKEKKLVAVYRHITIVWDLGSGKALHTATFNEKNDLKNILAFKNGLLIAGLHEMYVCSSSLEMEKTFRYDAIFEEGKAPDANTQTLEVSLKKENENSGLIDFFGGIFLSEDGKQIHYLVFSGNYNQRYRGIYTIDSETFTKIKHTRCFDACTIKASPDKKHLYRLNLLSRNVIKKGEWPQDPMGKSMTYGSSSPNEFISAYAAGNKYLCFGDHSGTVVVSTCTDNRHRFVLKGHTARITQLTVSANEKYLLSADEKGLILLWDLDNGKLVRPFTGTAHAIHSILYNPKGDKLAIGFNNGEVKVWDLFSNEQKKLNLHSIKGKDLQWSVLKIEEIKNDSAVYFRCKGKDDKNTYVYDVAWNIYSDWVLLTEFAMNEKEAEKIPVDTIDLGNGQRITHRENLLVYLGKDSTTIVSGHSATISDIAYNSQYGYYTTASLDGTLKSWKPGSREALFTSGCMGERGYFHVLPEGHYFADKNSLQYLSFRMGEKIYPFEQFDVHFNRPDLVIKQFPFADSALVQSFERAYEKRKKRIKTTTANGWHPEDAPVVKIGNEQLVSGTNDYELVLSAQAGTSPLRYIYVEVNGVPEKLIETGNVFTINTNCAFKLNEGMNRITAYAENEDGVLSLKQEINVRNNAHKTAPNLYIVSIGSGAFTDTSMNLEYAGKDAKDILDVLGSNKHYGKVVKQLYTGKDVSKTMLAAIDKTLAEANVNDLVVIFYAGHGLLDKNLDYYLSTASTDFHHPEEQSILYTDLETVVARCRSRKKLLLLDACHSGEVDKEGITTGNTYVKVITGDVKFRGAQTEMEMGNNKAFELSRALFVDVDKSMGATIISSASGAELAMEGDVWNNGLFTHVVLTGIRSKKADLNGDKTIRVSELLYYVNEKVKTLTMGKQNPNGRAENIYYDFTIR